MIGYTLNDRYTIVEQIGGGGMANVYKAHDNRLGRDVAIKILKDEFADDRELVDNFRKESHSAARLNHQNIVGVFDVGTETRDDKKYYYIVMEIVNGKTLKDLIREKGKLTVNETINYGIQIAEGLLCAHTNGIVHRDIKPQNIIINNDNIPKVTDFGIAQGTSKNTMTERDIIGSVHYFSPEQAKGDKTDQRSDIYSLGLVFYEMLTGEMPFDGENPISIALKQVHENITIPSKINHEIPKAFDELILNMTQKDPSRRYYSLNEVLMDLRALEKKTDLEFSDTMIIPNPNRLKRDENISVDDQRRNRRKALESEKRFETRNKRTEKKERKVLPIIGGILLALLVSTGIFLIVLNSVTNKKTTEVVEAVEVAVPQLLGVNEDEARKILEDKKLVMEVVDRMLDEDFEPGDILSQDPDPNTMVEEGSTIRVIVNSDETGFVEVENYEGLKIEEAIDLLDDADLEYEIEYTEVEDEDEIGIVLKQNILEGTRIEKDRKIILEVGQEKEAKVVPMPNLLGQNIDTAIEVLESLNLIVGNISVGQSSNFDPNDVIGQTVNPDVEIQEGTIIDLTIAEEIVEKEPEEPEEPIEEPDTNIGNEQGATDYLFRFKMPSDEESVDIKVTKLEDGVSTDVYHQTHYSSEGTVEVPLSGSESSVFQIYINGVLFDTKPWLIKVEY